MLRIKELRNEKNISLRELATQVNIFFISQFFYSQHIHVPPMDTL